MKRIKLLFALASLVLLRSERADAQITSIDAYTNDSLYNYCSLPSTGDFVMGAFVTGTPSATDSITYNLNFGDGSDTTFKSSIFIPSLYSSGYARHTYVMPGTFSTKLIASAPGGAKDTAYGSVFVLSTTCGTVNGHLYIDTNSNCTKDVGETELDWTPITVVNTTTLDTFVAGWADHHGDYSLNLAPGTYTIIPKYFPGMSSAAPYLIPSCPSTGMVTLTVASAASYTKHFAYTCTGSITSYDAKTTLFSTCFTPGNSTLLYIWAGTDGWRHYSCVLLGLSTTLTVNLDPKLTYLGVFPSLYYSAVPSSVSGSTLTYTLSTIADLSNFLSIIKVKTATTATIGDTIRLSSYIAPVSSITDPNLTNNTYNYKKAVVSSYDPNVKDVAPQGYAKEGYIAKNEEMTYTIHFQNTGTAAAKNITITDKIDPNLDINSIHLLGATHNTNLYKDGNSIKFRFEGINLPDSGSNYYGSMGSITYSIRQKKDLAPGSKMENTAAIYFDYNSPIITNTTLNTIMIPTVIDDAILGNDLVSVYPNPAQNTLNVKMDKTKAFSVRMLDMLGRVVVTQGTSNGELSINTSSVSNGLYIINIADNNGNETSKKVQIKH